MSLLTIAGRRRSSVDYIRSLVPMDRGNSANEGTDEESARSNPVLPSIAISDNDNAAVGSKYDVQAVPMVNIDSNNVVETNKLPLFGVNGTTSRKPSLDASASRRKSSIAYIQSLVPMNQSAQSDAKDKISEPVQQTIPMPVLPPKSDSAKARTTGKSELSEYDLPNVDNDDKGRAIDALTLDDDIDLISEEEVVSTKPVKLLAVRKSISMFSEPSQSRRSTLCTVFEDDMEGTESSTDATQSSFIARLSSKLSSITVNEYLKSSVEGNSDPSKPQESKFHSRNEAATGHVADHQFTVPSSESTIEIINKGSINEDESSTSWHVLQVPRETEYVSQSGASSMEFILANETTKSTQSQSTEPDSSTKIQNTEHGKQPVTPNRPTKPRPSSASSTKKSPRSSLIRERKQTIKDLSEESTLNDLSIDSDEQQIRMSEYSQDIKSRRSIRTEVGINPLFPGRRSIQRNSRLTIAQSVLSSSASSKQEPAKIVSLSANSTPTPTPPTPTAPAAKEQVDRNIGVKVNDQEHLITPRVTESRPNDNGNGTLSIKPLLAISTDLDQEIMHRAYQQFKQAEPTSIEKVHKGASQTQSIDRNLSQQHFDSHSNPIANSSNLDSKLSGVDSARVQDPTYLQRDATLDYSSFPSNRRNVYRIPSDSSLVVSASVNLGPWSHINSINEGYLPEPEPQQVHANLTNNIASESESENSDTADGDPSLPQNKMRIKVNRLKKKKRIPRSQAKRLAGKTSGSKVKDIDNLPSPEDHSAEKFLEAKQRMSSSNESGAQRERASLQIDDSNKPPQNSARARSSSRKSRRKSPTKVIASSVDREVSSKLQTGNMKEDTCMRGASFRNRLAKENSSPDQTSWGYNEEFVRDVGWTQLDYHDVDNDQFYPRKKQSGSDAGVHDSSGAGIARMGASKERDQSEYSNDAMELSEIGHRNQDDSTNKSSPFLVVDWGDSDMNDKGNRLENFKLGDEKAHPSTAEHVNQQLVGEDSISNSAASAEENFMYHPVSFDTIRRSFKSQHLDELDHTEMDGLYSSWPSSRAPSKSYHDHELGDPQLQSVVDEENIEQPKHIEASAYSPSNFHQRAARLTVTRRRLTMFPDFDTSKIQDSMKKSDS